MVYSSLISILIIFMVLFGAFFLGKYIANSNEMFNNNPFAIWVLGFISYMGITFVIFFPFVWVNPEPIYYVIIFFVKEFFMYSFLFIKKDKLLNHINWVSLVWIIGSGLVIVFVYNYGISLYTKDTSGVSQSVFNSWFSLKEAFAKFSAIDLAFVSKWIFGFISATTIYSVITSFFVEVSKKHNHWKYFSALIVTLIILTVMTIGISMDDSIGFFLLPYLLLVSIKIITLSRRRYGGLFGVISFVAWSIDPKSLLAITVLAFITTIIYSYMRKPKASLFWVQLIAPLLMLLSLELYRVSIILALAIFVLSALLYVFMLSSSRIRSIANLNKYVDRWRVAIPLLMLFSMWLAAIITISLSNVAIPWLSMHTTKNILYSNLENSMISTIIQIVIFIMLFFYLLLKAVNIIRKNKTPMTNDLIIVFSVVIILFNYNPIIERMFQSTFISEYFSRISYISIIPIFLLGVSKIKKRNWNQLAPLFRQ